MLALILAAVLNSAPAAHVEDAFLTAVYAAQGARAERARLGAWLDEQDRVRALAIERRANPFAEDLKPDPFSPDPKANPFSCDTTKSNPFDGPPKLFWWTTAETTKPERW